MKLKYLTPALLCAMLSIPVLTYAEDSDSNRTQPKTYAKDALITTKIKAKLADEESIKTLATISVDTVNNGYVTLTGKARTQNAIAKAEEIAKSTEGVNRVDNKIELKKDD